jgi:uncharacterized alkaline shock family protein YloU
MRPTQEAKGMEVYGLSGKSGTGKSYHSPELCAKYGIEAMIDDGLLIYRNDIVAGRSAKTAPTKLGAVKAAIFTKDEDRDAILEGLASCRPDKLLILGTSDKMVLQIAQRLGLDPPAGDHLFHIEDIASRSQMRKAQKKRNKDGMHVIPAPTLQVKKQFSGYFLDPRKAFREGKPLQNTEKTIVRPTYSYLGNFNISDKAISDIVNYLGRRTEGVAQVLFTASENTEEGLFVRTIIQVDYGINVPTLAENLQKRIFEDISAMTAFNVLGVDVEIRDFKFRK